MHNRRRTERARSAQPASSPKRTEPRVKPSSSRAQRTSSRKTTPVPSAGPSASTSANPTRQRQAALVPTFSQQISSPFPPATQAASAAARRLPELPIEDDVIWSSQLDENDFDESQDEPSLFKRTSGPLLSSSLAGINPTQGSELEGAAAAASAGGVATQIWRRGMGVLGDVQEDSLEAEAEGEEDAGPSASAARAAKGKGKATVPEGDRTPTQAQVDRDTGTAPSSGQARAGVPTRSESTVSQVPGISGLPSSFEGLSGIGGQNEFGVTQFEESLPVLRYNSRSATARSLPGEPQEEGAGLSFDPAVNLADPAESQVPPGPHSDIIYNRSGNPIARSSGEPLRPEGEEVVGPLVRSTRQATETTVQPAGADPASKSLEISETSHSHSLSLSDSQSQAQSVSSSHRRKKIEFGEYDPADDLVSFEYDPFKHGEDPARDRTGETTGPVYVPPVPLTAEERAERARGKKFLYEDDVAGNLEFGREKERQMVLDRHLRPLREIRAASGSASPHRNPEGRSTPVAGPSQPATAAAARQRTTGPTIGANPENPVLIDDPHTQQTPSPELTWSQMEEISRRFIREVIVPDRRRRAAATGLEDDEEEGGPSSGLTREDSMHGISLAQPPPFPLIYHESDEDEVATAQGTPAGGVPNLGGNVLVPNSSGSVLGVEDDSPVGDVTRVSSKEKSSQEEIRMGGWHKYVDDEQELDEDMDFLFPPRHLEPTSETGKASHIAKMFAGAAAKKATEKRLAATMASRAAEASTSKGKGRASGPGIAPAGPSASQPSTSSLGVAEGGMSSASKEFPPNQQALMKGRTARSEFSFLDSADPSQASKAGPTQASAVADTRPAHISRYPQPDAMSISTEDSVMRSQLFSSKVAAYNADQAGLKPGDEGYSAPPEDNYARWARGNREGASQAGSVGTVDTAKGKQPPTDPFAGAYVRMPGARGRPLSDVEEETRAHEVSHASGSSVSIVADSQEESPPLWTNPASVRATPNPVAKSSKTTDPRARPPATATTTTVVASSEVGPSRPRPGSPAKASRQPLPQTPSVVVKQTKVTATTTTGPVLAGGTGRSSGSSESPASFAGAVRRSKTPAEASSVVAESNSITSGSLIRSIEVVDPSPERSDAEAQIEADLIPETQYTQRTSRGSSPVLGVFSPAIKFKRIERQTTVLVPASASQSSQRFFREPSKLTPTSSIARSTDNEEGAKANAGEQSSSSDSNQRIQQDASFATSDTGTQVVGAAETTTSSVVIQSFELPDPPPPAVRPEDEKAAEERQQEQTAATSRKGGKKVPEKGRKVPDVPPPLPQPSEPTRRTRSVANRRKSPAASRRPMKVPAPPARLAVATRTRARTRTQTAALRSPSPPAPAPAAVSSPLSSLPTTSPELSLKKASPVRQSKTYLKSRTIVGETVREAPEKLNTSGEQDDPETSASLDPFKALAKSASKTRTETAARPTTSRQEIVDPFLAIKPSFGKRARPESPEEDLFSGPEELSPPPSKKRRADAAPQSTTRKTKASTSRAKSVSAHRDPQASAAPIPTSRTLSTSHRACQRAGRVFALWGKYYYTASVTDTWENGKEDVTTCAVDFDDGFSVEIPLTALYRCELREGDEVRIPGKKGKKLGRMAHVSAVPSWEERRKVSVRLSTAPKEEVIVINGNDLAVDAPVVEKKWKDRKVTSLEDIGLGEEQIREQEEAEQKKAEATAKGGRVPSSVMLAPPRWKSSPAPPQKRATTLPPRGKKRPPTAMEEPETETGHTEKRRRLLTPPPVKPFEGHVFVLALAVKDKAGVKLGSVERVSRKHRLTLDIQRLGGKVVDGFDTLLKWNGSISDDADRWIWEHGDLKYSAEEPKASVKPSKRGKRVPGSKGASDPAKLFLIADGANRNVKYMMALAAGVPCVDKGWIDDEGALPWTAYLLPAGECQSLHHFCSQWIDQTWYDHPRTLGSLLENPGPIRKALKDKSILFVYPSRSGTSMEEEKFSHAYVYASLACLMGASRVEAVHDIEAASLRPKDYDAIVYENNEVPDDIQKSVGINHGGKVICADFSWVSDCLISGTFLKLRDSA